MMESIREILTVRGEEAINALLATGRWKVLTLTCDGEEAVAVLVRVRA